ncbi:MAG: hypothetical protein ACI4OZ_09175 [Akkermansia sp.]
MRISLEVNKANVYDEVAKTTAYVGSKLVGDDLAYERIFTTDGDRQMLERFWVEACGAATSAFRGFLVSVSEQPESHGVELDRHYRVELEASSSFDETLKDSMGTCLFSFFVNSIVGKWCVFANKGEAELYGKHAVAFLDDVKRKLLYKKRPVRVKPSGA